MNKYEIIIYWSDEDEAFVAEVPELPGCAAHGSTEEAALASVKEAISLWIETAQEFGDTVPEPNQRLQPTKARRGPWTKRGAHGRLRG